VSWGGGATAVAWWWPTHRWKVFLSDLIILASEVPTRPAMREKSMFSVPHAAARSRFWADCSSWSSELELCSSGRITPPAEASPAARSFLFFCMSAPCACRSAFDGRPAGCFGPFFFAFLRGRQGEARHGVM